MDKYNCYFMNIVRRKY